MKIIKIANEFEDEGRDPLESPEAQEFEDQRSLEQEQKDFESGRVGFTHTFDIIGELKRSGVFDDTLNISSVPNGTVAWFKYNDGKIYEILVSPLVYSQHKNILEESLRPAPEEIDEDDDLMM